MGIDANTGADAPDAKGFGELHGFRLGPGGEEMLVYDRQARQKITQLEARIAELEALPRIWTGTEEEYAAASAAGKIRDGDIIITPEGDVQAQGAQEGAKE